MFLKMTGTVWIWWQRRRTLLGLLFGYKFHVPDLIGRGFFLGYFLSFQNIPLAPLTTIVLLNVISMSLVLKMLRKFFFNFTLASYWNQNLNWLEVRPDCLLQKNLNPFKGCDYFEVTCWWAVFLPVLPPVQRTLPNIIHYQYMYHWDPYL